MEASPLGPSRKVKAAIRKAIKDINPSSSDGCDRFRRLLTSKFGIGPDNILFANSVRELLFSIVLSLKPKKVLIVEPALNIYREAALAAGAIVESLCGTEENLFLPDMQTLVEKAEGADLVFLANPNRIVGNALSDVVLKEVFAVLSLKDCMTVVDESLIEFTGYGGCIDRTVSNGNVMAIRSTACYYGLPGLELAWAIAAPNTIVSLRRELRSEPGVLSFSAAGTAIKDKAYRRATAQFMVEEKMLFGKAAGRLQGVVLFNSDTNVILLKAPGKAVDIADRAGRAGLAVQLCEDIDGLSDAWLRISVMKHDHNLKLIRLMLEISDEKAGKGSNA